MTNRQKVLSFCSALSAPFALPPLSFSESTAAIICYTKKKKKKLFPRIPCRATSYSLFWAFPKEQEALWCHHISSVPPLFRFSLFLDNRFLPEAHRTGENRSHVPAVCICVCERQRQLQNVAAVNHCCNMKMWIFLLSYTSSLVSVPNIRARWFARTRLRHAVTLTHPYCTFFRQLPKSTRDNGTI